MLENVKKQALYKQMAYYNPMYKYSTMYVYVCLSFYWVRSKAHCWVKPYTLMPHRKRVFKFYTLATTGLPSAPLAPIIHLYECTTVYIKRFHIPLRCKQLLYSTQRKKRLWCITQMYSSRNVSAIAASLPLLLQCPSVMSNAQRSSAMIQQ